MDEALRQGDPSSGSLREMAAFAVRVAMAAERDEGYGHSDAWRRAHQILFSDGLAGRLEALAASIGSTLDLRVRSVCFSDEVRDLARSASRFAAA